VCVCVCVYIKYIGKKSIVLTLQLKEFTTAGSFELGPNKATGIKYLRSQKEQFFGARVVDLCLCPNRTRDSSIIMMSSMRPMRKKPIHLQTQHVEAKEAGHEEE